MKIYPRDRITRMQYARRNAVPSDMRAPRVYFKIILRSTARTHSLSPHSHFLVTHFVLNFKMKPVALIHSTLLIFIALVVYKTKEKSNTDIQRFLFKREFRLISLHANPVTDTLSSRVIRAGQLQARSQFACILSFVPRAQSLQ